MSDKKASRLPESILRGGNHLASALLTVCMPNDFTRYEDILLIHGQPWADIWICWKAIMDCRDGE